MVAFAKEVIQGLNPEMIQSGDYAIMVDENGDYVIEPHPLPPEDLLRRGIQHTRLLRIPVSSIVREESISSAGHVNNMKESLLQDGQQSPITVRARLLEDSTIIHDIIDGQHRTDAAVLGNIPHLQAVVKYSYSDEWVYDHRVLAVNSVREIQFARKVTWITNSFKQSRWYTEKNLSISSILSITALNTSGVRLGLRGNEANEAKDWVRQKCVTWNTPLTVLYQTMMAVEAVDPEIVKLVRIGSGGGHDGHGVFNEARFKEMAKNLQDNFPLQRMMYDFIIQHDLVKGEIAVVALALKKIEDKPDLIAVLSNNPRDLDLLKGLTGRKIGVVRGKVALLDEESFVRNAGVADSDEGDEGLSDEVQDDEEELLASNLDHLAPIETVVEEATESGAVFSAPSEETDSEIPIEEIELEGGSDDILPDELKPAKPIGFVKDNTTHHDYDEVRSPADYEKENVELQEALEKANAQLMRGGKSKHAWYETLATLTLQERDMMRDITKMKKKGIDLNDINTKLRHEYGLTSNQLEQLKRSAFSKWSLFMGDILQTEYDKIVGG